MRLYRRAIGVAVLYIVVHCGGRQSVGINTGE